MKNAFASTYYFYSTCTFSNRKLLAELANHLQAGSFPGHGDWFSVKHLLTPVSQVPPSSDFFLSYQPPPARPAWPAMLCSTQASQTWSGLGTGASFMIRLTSWLALANGWQSL